MSSWRRSSVGGMVSSGPSTMRPAILNDDANVRPAVMHLPGERQPAAPGRWSAGRFVIRSGHTPEEPAAGRESQNTRLGELFIDRPVSVTGRNPVASWGRERAMVQPDRLAASLTEEGRYQLLIEAVTDCAIYMLGPTGIVTSWNPGAQRFKGYAPAEIIGQHFSRFYTEEDQKTGLPARALEIAEREGKFENEGWRVRKDGTRFWAYVVIDPIRRPSGEIVGFAKITRDLTERREAQEKLDKTREVLLHSQKMDAIGQLTGGIAHDFNNLLMVVIGSLELMRKRLPD